MSHLAWQLIAFLTVQGPCTPHPAGGRPHPYEADLDLVRCLDSGSCSMNGS